MVIGQDKIGDIVGKLYDGIEEKAADLEEGHDLKVVGVVSVIEFREVDANGDAVRPSTAVIGNSYDFATEGLLHKGLRALTS